MRTHIVDLVAYADDPALADEIAASIAGLRHSRPSRALITCGRSDVDEVQAEPTVFCSPMQEGGKAIVCSEVVRLDGPAAGDGLASMAASLLLPDLPVFLLWVAPPDFERPVFRALRTLATRLVTDSTRFPETLDRLGAADRAGPRGGDRPGLDEDHRLARGGGRRSSTTPATATRSGSSSTSRSTT